MGCQESDVDEEPDVSRPHVDTTSSLARTLTVDSQGNVSCQKQLAAVADGPARRRRAADTGGRSRDVVSVSRSRSRDSLEN